MVGRGGVQMTCSPGIFQLRRRQTQELGKDYLGVAYLQNCASLEHTSELLPLQPTLSAVNNSEVSSSTER